MSDFRVKRKYDGKLRPKMGAPTMLSEELEEDIALFVKHMQLLRVPLTKEKLKDDIVHYHKQHNLKNPKMPHDGPGKLIPMHTQLKGVISTSLKLYGFIQSPLNIYTYVYVGRSWFDRFSKQWE